MDTEGRGSGVRSAHGRYESWITCSHGHQSHQHDAAGAVEFPAPGAFETGVAVLRSFTEVSLASIGEGPDVAAFDVG